MDKLKQLKLLTDIQNAINEIELYVFNNIHSNQKEFLDIPSQRVAERNLEIIGEAINQLTKINPDINITDKRKIINLRDKLIHNYDGIDPQLIIPVINIKIKVLKAEVISIISELTN